MSADLNQAVKTANIAGLWPCLCRSIRHLLAKTVTLGGMVALALLPAQAEAALSLGASNESFLSLDTVDEQATSQFQVISASVQLQSQPTKKQAAFWGLDAEAMFAVNDSTYFYFTADQAYWGMAKPLHFTVGRKLHEWNLLDETWKLGAWQPTFRWSEVMPREQGLTGLFYTQRFGEWTVRAFGSGLYLPNQGPSFALKGGQFAAANPWFIRPASRVLLGETSVPIEYELVEPSLDEILLQPQAALRLQWGTSAKNWLAVSYAYKPMNQIGLAYDAFLAAQTANVNVVIYPHIDYHHVLSLEGGVHPSKDHHLWLSALVENPEQIEISTQLTRMEYEPAYLLSPGWDWNVGKRSILTLTYLKLWQNEELNVGPQAATARTGLFAGRFPFKNALSANFKGQIWQRARHQISGEVRTVYDMSEQGMIVGSQFNYVWNRSWEVFLLSELVGAKESAVEQADFFSRNRANDRFSLGAKYAF